MHEFSKWLKTQYVTGQFPKILKGNDIVAMAFKLYHEETGYEACSMDSVFTYTKNDGTHGCISDVLTKHFEKWLNEEFIHYLCGKGE